MGIADKGKPEPRGQTGGPEAGSLRHFSVTESWEATPELPRMVCCCGPPRGGGGGGEGVGG